MKKLLIIPLLGCVLNFGGTLSAELIETIDLTVSKTIEHVENLPGISPERLTKIRPILLAKWDQLVKQGSLTITAPDASVRPLFVSMQGIVEHVLSTQLGNNITSLVGIIHTPMPASPLCTKGEVTEALVSEEILKDPLRLYTVRSRVKTIREFLKKSGQLYVAYPKTGLAKRAPDQQAIYANELMNYPSNLFDVPLNCEEIDPNFVGALYLFKNQQGELFAFSIKMTQANDPKELGHFGIWLGSLDHPEISTRVSEVTTYLEGVAPFPLPLL